MYTENDERIICKHEGCGNECPKPRLNNSKRAKGKEQYIQYKQCHACSNLISNYGINNGQRKKMLEEQNSRCAICFKEISFKGQTQKGDDNTDGAVLDHCHSIGTIRGILCHPCNRALGLFKDSPDILNSAIKYLQTH